ncbi:white-opaque regulator 1 [Chaetomidium leptoderma]|uniref:White-opaque regulator 1 n=1 Tax=Chaetomidium leptoderma TaxID=669021 RepID=A0AAN6VTS7_9PEZI|nr:white-opaque regulator 1 [Chaetomidium leptoderma]
MVYCGKASQGCQNCRTRRIKCDKVRPQCTQCVRVRKQCPGYRDQLSLMFRDESTKVMQKAHAQWGVAELSELGDSAASSPTSTPPSSTRGRSLVPETATPRPTTLATRARKSPEGKRLVREICATPIDKAIQFYVEHYVIGLPDEPRVGQELQGTRWVHSPETRDIMAAVGLAALSNLTGDKEMDILAKHHYGLALQNMASTVRNIAGVDIDLVLRAVVMMAMYEVTRGRNEPLSPARTHVMGCAAILSSALPLRHAPADGPRGLLQLCFSMVASKQGSYQYSSPEPNVLIPTHPEPPSEGALPDTFFDWISISDKMVTEPDRPSAELIKIIARFTQLSALVRTQPLVDGQPKTADVIGQALEINDDLEAWERRQDGAWAVVEKQHAGDFFPAEAVFEGCYHVYDNTYIARVWNHYRWARSMVSQLLLESVDRFPASSSGSLPVSPAQQRRRLALSIRRLARDTLVSIPTHYRHPNLAPAHWDCFDKTKRGAGIGIAGIPTLLFEIKVAGCAPGVPDHYRTWALRILETAYQDTGMFQAKALAVLLGKMVENESSRSSSPLSVGEGR